MDQTDLATFLRTRREALQPEDVGMPRGQRRCTPGLRREEVAALCGMSADYYSRLERGRGPHPSQDMLTSIARGLHLTLSQSRWRPVEVPLVTLPFLGSGRPALLLRSVIEVPAARAAGVERLVERAQAN